LKIKRYHSTMFVKSKVNVLGRILYQLFGLVQEVI
jgi:hypothetical protein